jgi:hypothetical protein
LHHGCRDCQARWSLGHPLVPRDELKVATAFSSMRLGVGVDQEILKGLQEERTKPAAFRIGLFDQISFQDQEEKLLR